MVYGEARSTQVENLRTRARS